MYIGIFIDLCIVICIQFVEAVPGNATCYINISLLEPTGRRIGGVNKSEAEILDHMTRVNKYRKCFELVGTHTCIHPAVIAGLASRVSRVGEALNSSGWLDHSSYGIMSCNVNVCPVCEYNLTCQAWKFDSCCHIMMLTRRVLVPYTQNITREFPNWTHQQQLQGGVAAYNFGVDDVRTWEKLDIGTNGNDFSNDVIARAQYLIRSFGWQYDEKSTNLRNVDLTSDTCELDDILASSSQLTCPTIHAIHLICLCFFFLFKCH